MRNKAKDYYLGKAGKRYNCAQSVSQAYRDVYGFYHPEMDRHAECGGGKAPQGYCGSLHAMLHILQLSQSDKIDEGREFFLKSAGALTCKEIKSGKRFPCVDCVPKAAEFLEKVSPHKK